MQIIKGQNKYRPKCIIKQEVSRSMGMAYSMNNKGYVKYAIIGLWVACMCVWLLLKSPVLSPTITINTFQFPAQESQLFFKHGGSYIEGNSSVAKINSKSQKFEFQLPFYDNTLRWDPLEKGGSFYVSAAAIHLFGFSSPIDLQSIKPLSQIQENASLPNLLSFTVPEGNTDPQIQIQINSKYIDKIRFSMALVLGAVVTILLMIWITKHEQILERSKNAGALVERFKKHLVKEDVSLSEFLQLLALGLVLNIVPITNFFLSIDDEMGAFRTDASVWIADGRWTAFLIERFIFPQPVLPFAPNLFFYACLAISYILLLRAHKLRLTWITVLAYCVFIVHPIWWFIGEFYSNIPSTAIGVLSVSIAIYIYSTLDSAFRSRRYQVLATCSSGVLLAIAIGAYQSLTMLYLAMGLGVILFELKSRLADELVPVKAVLHRAGFLLLSLLIGLAIYLVVNKLAQTLYPSDRAYIDGLLRISELTSDPLRVVGLVGREMWRTYTGSSEIYGVSFSSAAWASALGIAFAITQKTWKASVWMSIVVVGLLVAPFLLHFAAGGSLPLRSMLAVAYISWVIVILTMENAGLIRAVGAGVTLILLAQMVMVNGQYSASTILSTTHDRLTAEALYSRMAQLDKKFDRDAALKIDIYGQLPFSSIYPSPNSSTMGASFFNWDRGNMSRMLTYMRLLGYSNASPLKDSARIASTYRFDGMPIWPAADSVRLEEGVYYIKLGNEPDPVHALYQR
jgi:Glucosyl transferase GtrII